MMRYSTPAIVNVSNARNTIQSSTIPPGKNAAFPDSANPQNEFSSTGAYEADE